MVVVHRGADRGDALDFLMPIRHVATQLEAAGVRGLTVAESADSYGASNGDLTHGGASDAEASRFLIDRALSALGEQVCHAQGAGRYRLVVPFDELRYEGNELHRYS